MKIMKILSAVIVSMALIICTGCNDAGHVHSKYYVRAIALSGTEDKSVVFDFYNEKAEPYYQRGDSFENIKKDSETELGKEIFTGHTELILLSDCDYASQLEYLLTEWKVSPSCVVVYADGGLRRITEELDAERLASSVRKAEENGDIPKCDIVTVLSGLLSGNSTAVIAKADKNGLSGSIEIKGK